MTPETTKLMTAEEFFAWASQPENQGRLQELERGQAVERPLAGEQHGVVCANVTWLLSVLVRQRHRGYVSSNRTGIVVERNPDTVLGPDVALFDDLCSYADLIPHFSERLPKLVVEVLAPTDALGRVLRRGARFLARGVPLVWLVDPQARNLTVCRPDRPPLVVEENEDVTSADVLPELHCRVAELFALPGQFGQELSCNRQAYETLRDQIRKEYAGQYVAIAQGPLIAVSTSFEEALAAVRQLRPAPEHYVVFPAEEEPAFEPVDRSLGSL